MEAILCVLQLRASAQGGCGVLSGRAVAGSFLLPQDLSGRGPQTCCLFAEA